MKHEQCNQATKQATNTEHTHRDNNKQNIEPEKTQANTVKQKQYNRHSTNNNDNNNTLKSENKSTNSTQ